jgi:hypothetical protein
MRWQEFIDGYDWKARRIRTVIALMPLFCTVYYFFPRAFWRPGDGLLGHDRKHRTGSIGAVLKQFVPCDNTHANISNPAACR